MQWEKKKPFHNVYSTHTRKNWNFVFKLVVSLFKFNGHVSIHTPINTTREDKWKKANRRAGKTREKKLGKKAAPQRISRERKNEKKEIDTFPIFHPPCVCLCMYTLKNCGIDNNVMAKNVKQEKWEYGFLWFKGNILYIINKMDSLWVFNGPGIRERAFLVATPITNTYTFNMCFCYETTIFRWIDWSRFFFLCFIWIFHLVSSFEKCIILFRFVHHVCLHNFNVCFHICGICWTYTLQYNPPYKIPT